MISFYLLYLHTQYIPIHLYIYSQWGGGIAALARPPPQFCGYIIIELVSKVADKKGCQGESIVERTT